MSAPASTAVSASPTYLDATATLDALDARAAVEAIRSALLDGFDPASDHRRLVEPLTEGEFLLMPSQVSTATGIKVLTVAPGNPSRALPRIQGIYILFDSGTLTPRLLLDGAALTRIRTPAVSIATVGHELLREAAPLEVVLFGAGPQGLSHLETVRAVIEGHRPLGPVTFVVRNPDRVGGLPAEASVAAASSAEARRAVASADLIVCATTAREPLFDSSDLRSDCVVVAVGSHEPDARELDSALLGRAQVIVEDAGTALRESGDVVVAIAEGALEEADLIAMADVVRGRPLDRSRPIVFKSSGMSWEDLVIAQAIADRR